MPSEQQSKLLIAEQDIYGAELLVLHGSPGIDDVPDILFCKYNAI